jgi:pseudouridine-5'-phosphate glycosidase
VPVLGYRTDELPLFYSAGGGPPVAARVDSPEQAARTAGAHWGLGGAALLLVREPDDGIDVEPLVEEALEAAAAQHVRGQAVTPFVLSFLHERSGGRTLEVNRDLIVANAALAAQVAVAAA